MQKPIMSGNDLLAALSPKPAAVVAGAPVSKPASGGFELPADYGGVEDYFSGVSVSAAFDPQVVSRIAREYTKTEIIATRAVTIANGGPNEFKIISEVLALDPANRSRLFKVLTGALASVPAPANGRQIIGANETELRLAFENDRPAGIRKITWMTLMDDLLRLGRGLSGAEVGLDQVTNEFTYGPPGATQKRVPCPFEYPPAEEMKKLVGFVEMLAKDGHDITVAFGDPYRDFMVALFGAMYSMTWSGKLKAMTVTARPRADKHMFQIKTSRGYMPIALLSPVATPFKAQMQDLVAKIQAEKVPETVQDWAGWVWERCPVIDEARRAQIVGQIAQLRLQFREEFTQLIASLSCELVEFFVGSSSPGFFLHKMQSQMNILNAITDLGTAREYRGRTDGQSAAAFLNNEAKDVGTRPLGGHLNAVPTDVRRYWNVLESASVAGVKTVSIYNHSASFGLKEIVKQRLGIDVAVYSTVDTSGFPHADIARDGFHASDSAQLAIVDQFVRIEKQVAGENPIAAQWNVQNRIFRKCAEAKRPVYYFGRMAVVKDGAGRLVPNIEMYRDVLVGNTIAVTFRGVRSHNGEIGWIFGNIGFPDVPSFDCVGTQIVDGLIPIVEKVVAGRVLVANQCRTAAVPFGIWNFETGIVELQFSKDQIVAKDPMADDLKLLHLRTDPGLRSVLAESHTVSTAPKFSESGVTVNLETHGDVLKHATNKFRPMDARGPVSK